MQDQDDKDLKEPLLSDDELVALVDGGYRKEAPAADEVGMARNWRALQEKTAGAAAKPAKKSRAWLGGLAGLAAAAVLVLLVRTWVEKPEGMGVKGGGAAYVADGLSLVVERDGKRETLEDQADMKGGAGKILLLGEPGKMAAGVGALALLVGPEAGTAPTGVHTFVGEDDSPAFIVEAALPAAPGRYKACIATAPTFEALSAKVDVMQQFWTSVAGESCRRFVVRL